MCNLSKDVEDKGFPKRRKWKMKFAFLATLVDYGYDDYYYTSYYDDLRWIWLFVGLLLLISLLTLFYLHYHHQHEVDDYRDYFDQDNYGYRDYPDNCDYRDNGRTVNHIHYYIDTSTIDGRLANGEITEEEYDRILQDEYDRLLSNQVR